MLKLSRFLICISPLLWYSGMQAGFSIPRLIMISAAVVFGGIGIFDYWQRELRSTPLDVPIILFTLTALASTITSIDIIDSVIGQYNDYANGLMGMGLCVACYYIGAWSLPYCERTFFRIIVGVTIIAVFSALAQKYHFPFSVPLGEQEQRVSGNLGHPVHLGTLIGMTSPLVFFIKRRWARAGYLFIMVTGLALCQSRGGLISAIIGMGVALFVIRPPTISYKNIIAYSLTSLVLALSLIAMRTDTGTSDTFRISAFRVAWVQIKNKPFLGTGPDTYLHSFRRYRDDSTVKAVRTWRRTNAHAHNDIAQIASTMGSIGLFAWLFLFVSAGLALWRRAAADNQFAAGVGLLAAIIVSMKFNPTPIGLNAIACFSLGVLLRDKGILFTISRNTMSHIKRGTLVIFGAVALIVSLRLADADISFQYAMRLFNSGAHKGAILFARRAVHLDPTNDIYKIEKWNMTREIIRMGADRDILLREIAADAMVLARLRPKVFDGHYLAGVTALNLARSGDKEMLTAAKNALTLAQKLNPQHGQIAELLIEIEKRMKSDSPH